jgi:peptidyl-prolyl cis-trans isomerase C
MSMKPTTWMAAGLAVTLVLIGCAKEEVPSIAKVNGTPITVDQFDAYLEFKRLPGKDDKRREALLDQYLDREALAAVIEQEGKLNKRLMDAELDEFRKEMIISRYFDQFLREKISDEAVQNYYATHAGDYEDRKVHVAHILVRTQRGMSEVERKARLTTAQEAYSRVMAGQDFAEIAKAYSEDTISGRKGGDLGWLKEGAVDPRFSETVFSMQPGDVSQPFETAFGFHVVKLLEGPVVVKRPLEAVKGDIRYQLRNQAKQAELERLLSKAQIVKTEGQ